MREVVQSLLSTLSGWLTVPVPVRARTAPPIVPKGGPDYHRGVEIPDDLIRVTSRAPFIPVQPPPDPARDLAYLRRRLGRDEAMPWPSGMHDATDLTGALIRTTRDLSRSLRDALPAEVRRTIRVPRYPGVGCEKGETLLGDVVSAAARHGLLDTLPVSRDVLRELLTEHAYCLINSSILFTEDIPAGLDALDAIAPGGIDAALVRAHIAAHGAGSSGEQMPGTDRAVVVLENALAVDRERTLRAVKSARAFDRLAGHPRFDALVAGRTPPASPLTHADLADLFARDELLQKAVSYFDGGASAFHRYIGRVGTEPLSEKEEDIPGLEYYSRAIRAPVREYFKIDHRGVSVESIAMKGGVGSEYFTGLDPGSFVRGGRQPNVADLAKLDVAKLLETARAVEAHFHPKRAAGTLVLPTLATCKASPERVQAARELVEGSYNAPQTIYRRQGTLFRRGMQLGDRIGLAHDTPEFTELRAALAERLEWTEHECTYGAAAISAAEREALIVLVAESRLA